MIHSPLYTAYMQSPKWAATRQTILHRDRYRCRACRARHRLHVHHLTYTRLGAERPADLVTLCQRCHGLVHDGIDWFRALRPLLVGLLLWLALGVYHLYHALTP